MKQLLLLLLLITSSVQMSAMHQALLNRNIRKITELLNKGEDINGTYGTWTPLLYASGLGNNIDLLELLIMRGAEIDNEQHSHNSPLLAAIHADSDSINKVALLLRHKADVNKQHTPDGFTPLMKAAQCENYAIINLLLEHQADPSIADSQGWTAVDHSKDVYIKLKLRNRENK